MSPLTGFPKVLFVFVRVTGIHLIDDGMNRPYAAKLHELLQSSFNLPNAVVDLGRIELGPSEVRDVTHRLYERDREHTGIDAKAHYLLATSGFNAEQVLSDIAQIRVAKRDRDAKPTEVKAEKKSDMVVNADFDKFLSKHLSLDWDARKRELYELLNTGSAGSDGVVAGGANSEPTNQRLGQRLLGSLGTPKSTPETRAYGEIVTQLCDANLSLPDLVTKFAAVAPAVGGTAGYLQDSWRALELGNAQTFLEQQYRDFIAAELRAHRLDVRLGGVPSNYAQIKAFVALKHSQKDSGGARWDPQLKLVNKTPIWAQLYYLVRAGYLKDAQQVVLERQDIFETLGSSFALYFKAWVESPAHDLSPHNTQMIHAEFHQLARQSDTDPYKLALYKVIGRCDIFKRTLPAVAVTTEDWLWLQLMLSRAGSQYTFEDVQKYVESMGPDLLAPHEPAKYFGLLAVLGLYKSAIEYLRKFDETHAVHYAIAVRFAKGVKIASLAELISRYTRFFRSSSPGLAVDYLALAAPDQPRETHEALQELVLECGKYSLLLGDVQAFTEKPISGCIEQRQGVLGTDSTTIARGAAQKAYEDGRTVDAILLYRLGNEPQRVLELVNAQLGLLLSSVPLGQPVNANMSSFDILQLARNVMRVDGDTLAKTPGNRDTCLILLAIADCLDLLAQKEWQPCLDRLSQTGLLVLSPQPAVSQVRELAQQFLTYDLSIARNIPNVLLMALTCILRITETLKQQGQSVAGRLIDQYRGRASNCMVYAGLIQFRMPREVYARLAKMEAELVS